MLLDLLSFFLPCIYRKCGVAICAEKTTKRCFIDIMQQYEYKSFIDQRNHRKWLPNRSFQNSRKPSLKCNQGGAVIQLERSMCLEYTYLCADHFFDRLFTTISMLFFYRYMLMLKEKHEADEQQEIA